MKHKVQKLVDFLRQVLEQDKRPIAFLLGAGCPLAIRVEVDGKNQPLIPDIAGLTQRISEKLGVAAESPWAKVSDQIPREADKAPNIEQILSQVRLLKQVVGNTSVYGLDMDALNDLERGICSDIVECVNQQLISSDSPYHKLARWLAATSRTYAVTLFTTNYDLLAEQALEETGVPFFDGLVGSRQPFFDPHAMEEDSLPVRWARLWKLHGSVNWHQEGKAVWRGPTTGGTLVYPSHLKYDQSRRMPYLAMMDRLRAFLKEPGAVLVTCGYSFSDDHINEIIVQGLQGNTLAAAFALQYGTLDESTEAVQLAKDRPNLSVLAKDGAVIGGRRDDWERVPSGEVVLDTPGVDWVDEKLEGRTFRRPILRLGDFAKFGELVQDLSSTYRNPDYAN